MILKWPANSTYLNSIEDMRVFAKKWMNCTIKNNTIIAINDV